MAAVNYWRRKSSQLNFGPDNLSMFPAMYTFAVAFPSFTLYNIFVSTLMKYICHVPKLSFWNILWRPHDVCVDFMKYIFDVKCQNLGLRIELADILLTIKVFLDLITFSTKNGENLNNFELILACVRHPPSNQMHCNVRKWRSNLWMDLLSTWITIFDKDAQY